MESPTRTNKYRIELGAGESSRTVGANSAQIRGLRMILQCNCLCRDQIKQFTVRYKGRRVESRPEPLKSIGLLKPFQQVY